MKIFALSGLGADERVFEYLTLDFELVPIKWLHPTKNETIVAYTTRLIKHYGLQKETDFGVLGVSFGGLISAEISKQIMPKFTILISSVETKKELPGILRLIGKSRIINLIPAKLLNPPKTIAHYLFGAQNIKLLNSILDDTDLSFAKWAIKALVNWQNQTTLHNLIKISGSKDKLFPPKGKNDILIEKGEHFMIVDRAAEISDIINYKMKSLMN